MKWTPEQINLILQCNGKFTVKELSVHLQKPISYVVRKIYFLRKTGSIIKTKGSFNNRNDLWNKQDISCLRENARHYTTKELYQKYFSKFPSEKSVMYKCYKLGIKFKHVNPKLQPNFKDLTGKIFGKWLVIKRENNSKNGGCRWLVKCNCGSNKTSIVNTNQLKSGRSKSCGCYLKEILNKRAHDLKGKKFGKLTVIEKTDEKNRLGIVWKCKCDCGNVIDVVSSCLLSPKRLGIIKSCGCSNLPNTNFVDLTGKRYNRLLVIKRLENGKNDRNAYWLCRCDCGKETKVATRHLNYGNVSSCGCYKRNQTSLVCSSEEHKNWCRMVGSMYGGRKKKEM